jgi:NAD(P)H dehydrogenase (quinone)
VHQTVVLERLQGLGEHLPMSLVITGATGQLGRLVVQSLLDREVRADDIVATGRNLNQISDLADRGVRTLVADYDDIDSLRAAFAGADKVLLVSGSEAGQRVPQHQNAIEAAEAAGVGLLAYTSIANADRTDILLAADHQATEKLLAESGVPYTLLRNNLYLDLYADQLPAYIEHGAVVGSAGHGRLSAATPATTAGLAGRWSG